MILVINIVIKNIKLYIYMKNIKLLFLFLLLLASIAVLFYFGTSYNSSTESSSIEDDKGEIISDSKSENINSDKVNTENKSKLIMYWANWCGICQKIKPNWENAKNLIKSKYPDVEIVDINCDNPQKNKCFSYVNGKQQTLEGVPTIVLRKNNNDIEYKKDLKNNFKGDRSVDELVRFTEINK